MTLPCLLDMAHPLFRDPRIGTLAHRGPVGHLAGTAARTVRRVRRNDLTVLSFLANARAKSLEPVAQAVVAHLLPLARGDDHRLRSIRAIWPPRHDSIPGGACSKT
jgi:hypothetical protein